MTSQPAPRLSARYIFAIKLMKLQLNDALRGTKAYHVWRLPSHYKDIITLSISHTGRWHVY